MEAVKYLRHPVYNYGCIDDKDSDNKIYNFNRNKFIKDYKYDNGIIRISIKINNKFKLINKERFIYECFTQSVLSNKDKIKHINNNNGDNRFNNLELIKSENIEKKQTNKYIKIDKKKIKEDEKEEDDEVFDIQKFIKNRKQFLNCMETLYGSDEDYIYAFNPKIINKIMKGKYI